MSQTLTTIDQSVAARQAALAAMTPLERLAYDIGRDYERAMEGMRSYVAMGIRLHTVKAQLPHGEFMVWCAKNITVKKTHIGDSMRIAKGIAEMCGIQITDASVISHTEESPLLAMVEGQTHRQLVLAVKEFRQDPTEEASRLWCEERWAKNPGDRDDWEPRVLSGEITYIFAKIGMLGIETSKGQTRPDPAYEKLLARNAGSYTQIWEKWETLPEPVRHEGIAKLQDAFTGAPDEVKRSLLRALQTPAAIPA
jgi:hypothetical protein